MEVVVENKKVSYVVEGKGKDLVLLHGWGQNKEMMLPLFNILKDEYKVYSFDLPGFGESDEPETIFSVHDYADYLHEVFKKLKINKPMLVGHSYGGKISLVYGANYEVDSLVLLASPAFAASEISLKTKILKSLKKVPLLDKLAELAKNYIGSEDYRNAKGIMREILISTVNTDITEDLKQIKVPTIFIFGTMDEAVSIEDARKMEELVKDSALILQEGGTHYAYLEFLGQTVEIIKSLGGRK